MNQKQWRAVLQHDAQFDGAFVYAVRSTGIYCRPSCPSRRPAPRQVVFFPLPEAAERAGFRACRRCRPRDASAASPALRAVQETCRLIESSLDEPLRLAGLAKAAGLSPYHFQRTFKRALGISPREYADLCRLATLKRGLKKGGSVTTAMYEAGYGSSSRLYERAGSQLGMTPAVYQRGGKGMRIGYATAACALGRLLVAATERGVCAVCIGDADGPLEAALREEYPNAGIRHRPALGGWVKQVLQTLSAGRAPDVPLDIKASAFQWRVWQELQRIPRGETRSYSQVAKAIGMPKAARAVARACATNPVALVVPCHRVVRENGDSGGYRWGAARKQRLLQLESGTG